MDVKATDRDRKAVRVTSYFKTKLKTNMKVCLVIISLVSTNNQYIVYVYVYA